VNILALAPVLANKIGAHHERVPTELSQRRPDRRSNPPPDQHATEAAAGLSGARHSRAVELRELIADAIAFARRLSIVVQGDQRAKLQSHE
jgi:hypothetical protein